MTNSFLQYYNRELTHIRHLTGEFAKANPKTAKHLRMSADNIEDPHISRLIESFAYLNANTQLKLDNDFSEINEALLNTLYPHYINPIPSMAIFQFKPAADLKENYFIPKGTLLATDTLKNHAGCSFQVSADTYIIPAVITQVRYENHCQHAPSHPYAKKAQACLKISLECSNPKAEFKDILKNAPLRFNFRGQTHHSYALYELIHNDSMAVAIVKNEDSTHPIHLSKECLSPVGFEEEQAILPFSKQTFAGYRLLAEFFCFPEKFLFFDLLNLDKYIEEGCHHLDIYIYFKTANLEFERSISKNSLALNCNAMINLFEHEAEPMQFRLEQSEYPVVPDAYHSDSYETYNIQSVYAINTQGEEKELSPFYSLHTSAHPQHWIAHRQVRTTNDPVQSGSDIFLNFINTDKPDFNQHKWAFYVKTYCFNRNLPRLLPFGGGQPFLQFTDRSAPISRISCLVAPTSTLRPEIDGYKPWEFISQLNLNFLSLVHDEQGIQAFRSLLELHNIPESDDNHAMIQGIISISTRRISTRSPDGRMNAFCTGTEITVEFDQDRFAGNSIYLFASILERFFALYCSINSFTKMIATTKGKKKIIKSWQPRTGYKTLL